MHPELEFFLEDAFKDIQPTTPAIGRVVVQPDYNVAPEAKDSGRLKSELVQCLNEASVDEKALSSTEGYELEISGAYRLLRKYIRSVTLHSEIGRAHV